MCCMLLAKGASGLPGTALLSPPHLPRATGYLPADEPRGAARGALPGNTGRQWRRRRRRRRIRPAPRGRVCGGRRFYPKVVIFNDTGGGRIEVAISCPHRCYRTTITAAFFADRPPSKMALKPPSAAAADDEAGASPLAHAHMLADGHSVSRACSPAPCCCSPRGRFSHRELWTDGGIDTAHQEV